MLRLRLPSISRSSGDGSSISEERERNDAVRHDDVKEYSRPRHARLRRSARAALAR